MISGYEMDCVKGKVAIITGAAGGLDRVMALLLAKEVNKCRPIA